MDKNSTNKLLGLYTAYIEGLKRLSAQERDEISRVILKYKNTKEKITKKHHERAI